ncbi:DUF2285 domain-containing protein [Komagataeibacter rhaeticus]|nr:DUF2285 domain-containing protein [Komagataeibacter rhaeticus]
MFGREVSARDWLSHDLHFRMKRMVHFARGLTEGGYRRLLLHPFRGGDVPECFVQSRAVPEIIADGSFDGVAFVGDTVRRCVSYSDRICHAEGRAGSTRVSMPLVRGC